jgi:hypothetical protein
MNTTEEKIELLLMQHVNESSDRIMQLLMNEMLICYPGLSTDVKRMIHIHALTKVIVSISVPALIFGDEGELLKGRAKEYGLYACHAAELIQAIIEQLHAWTPGDKPENLVESVIDTL